MFFSWWRRFVHCKTSSTRGSRRAEHRKRQVQYRPWVETLEGRVVPSQVRFINATGGDWDNPSNWSNGQLPTRFDDAIIDMNVTVTHGGIDEVNSLTQSQGTLTLFGGNLSFDAPSTVLSGATLNLNGGDLGLYGDVNDHSHPGLLTMNGVCWPGFLTSPAMNSTAAMSPRLYCPTTRPGAG